MRICPECQRSYSDEMQYCPLDATPLPPPRSATQYELSVGLANRYRILRRLGEGGMGTVFLAEQIAVGSRQVALKVLRRRLLDDPEFLQRFQEEASSTGRIHHPNIVTVYECGQTDDGSPYIAMEFLDGQSLGDVIDRRGSFPLAEAADILQQAARGLNAAHRLGIIHRDLKPDNIFLTLDDEGKTLVKIVDFGIAKMRESRTHTVTGMSVGTPAYMSFEQASGMRSEHIDARSDIYSLGIVAYEMITGRLPFQADTPTAYYGKHLFERPAPIGNIPPQLEQVLMKSLEKQRDDRYSSALDFARDFARAAGPAAEPIASRPMTPDRPVYVPPVGPPVRPPVTPPHAFAASTPPPVQPVQQNTVQPKKPMSFGKFLGIVAIIFAVIAVPLIWMALSHKPAPTPPPPDTTTPAPAPTANTAVQERNLGDTAYGSKDYITAIQHYRTAAEQGDGLAMADLGIMYRDGKGVTKDYTQSREWFEKSAATGDGDGMNGMGWLYENAMGVPRNYSVARQWYVKAAAAGNANAMNNLGWLAQKGLGVPVDYGEAREWYEKAAAKDNYMAMNNLGNMYWSGYSVPQDYVKARQWYEKAAVGDVGYAMETLGDIYHQGLGVPRDDAQAKTWYSKALAAGDNDARDKLKGL